MPRLESEDSLLPRRPRGGRPREGQELPETVLQEKLGQIEKGMKEHEGELVLMVNRHWEQYSFDMPEEMTHYGLDVNYSLGIVTPPYLNVGDTLEVCTEGHVDTTNRQLPSVDKKEKGSIHHWNAYPHDLDRLSVKEDRYPCPQQPSKLLEIVVGDQAVSEWLDQELFAGVIPDNWREFAARDDKFSPIYTEMAKRSFDLDLFLAFQKMARAFGKELQLPEITTRIKDEVLQGARTKTLGSLFELL